MHSFRFNCYILPNIEEQLSTECSSSETPEIAEQRQFPETKLFRDIVLDNAIQGWHDRHIKVMKSTSVASSQ